MSKPRITRPYVVYNTGGEALAAVFVEFPVRLKHINDKYTNIVHGRIRARFGGFRVRNITETEWGTICAMELVRTFKGHFVKSGELDFVSVTPYHSLT